MNINQNINKLLYALKQQDKIYKINSFKFYSKKKDKYAIKYQVWKKELVEHYDIKEDKIKIEEIYKLKKEYYSNVDVMKYLAKEYKKGSE